MTDAENAAVLRHWLSEHGTKPKVKAAIERAIEKLEEPDWQLRALNAELRCREAGLEWP